VARGRRGEEHSPPPGHACSDEICFACRKKFGFESIQLSAGACDGPEVVLRRSVGSENERDHVLAGACAKGEIDGHGEGEHFHHACERLCPAEPKAGSNLFGGQPA
jgi:hypothetical protein